MESKQESEAFASQAPGVGDAGSADVRPLVGIKVLDFTHIAAGPLATSMLGDMGATVIKVESPGGGDPTRHYDEVFPGADGSYFLGINRSKRSIAIDLKSKDGLEIVRKLALESDVVVENYRPGVLRKMGLDYPTLSRVNTSIIYCSIAAFGTTGPYVARPGMDILVQGMGGMMGVTGERGQPPVKVGAPIADFIGSYLALYGITLALLARERQGLGQLVEISLLDGQIASLANYLTGFHQNGKPDGPSGGQHPQLVPYQVFGSSDGYLIVACLTEGFWTKLCPAIGRPDLANDPRFATNKVRTLNRALLIPILAEIFEQKTRGEWTALLAAADVPCGPVNTLADAFSDPQVVHNGMVQEIIHPKAGRIKVPGIAVKLSRTPGRISAPPPLLGEHTEQVLADLGYSNEAIAGLKAAGVI